MNLASISTKTNSIIKEVGEFIKKEQSLLSKADFRDKNRGDPVSKIDVASEGLLRDKLTALLPSSVFMAEEESPRASGGEWRWIVDPIDGTLNYVRGLPIYAISVALEDRRKCEGNEWGEIVLGAIYVPVIDQLFHSVRGEGAFQNGHRIHVRETLNSENAVLATGFPFAVRENLDSYMNAFQAIFSQVGNVRRIGSAAYDLACVANGSFDGFWEMHLHPWDIAAGIVLIEEAGGIITDFWGDNPLTTNWVATGTASIHKLLRKELMNHFNDRSSWVDIE
ncbi:inositol monophosphatase [bacterium]|nr:inositol monophosphatase [bacterium]